MNDRQFGPKLTKDGTRFRLWAPAAKRVDLLLQQPHAMQRGDDGWFSTNIPGAKSGARYKFRIDDEIDVPDPAADFQPEDVFGPSEVIDHAAFRWRATEWRGRPWQEAVIIEAHVGTFTQDGSYRAMIGRLDHLVQTGITALELLPLADFAGSRNWGYDGVLWYAPDSAYGRPEDLNALIDEAHLRGLMVFLDVVYNHFGPEGNYLGRYAPGFFTEAHTPWGSAIDYHVPQARAFAIENALHWLRDYRFDGLRLDAVNSIVEPGGLSVLHDLSMAVGQFAAATGRHIHLVLENGDNRASILDAAQDPPRGKYRAQWNDDYHHAWRVLMTREKQGYYCDYQRSPLDDIARSLSSGFVYQGEVSEFRGGARGEPSGKLAPTAFINFLQNHDQIGNRAFGDRLEAVADPKAIEAALAVMLLAPAIPMLFMGEEWGSKTPFPFFCDFKGGLADAVRKGRRSEYAWAYAEYGDEVPDALALSTFQSAVLDWNERAEPAAQRRQSTVQQMLAIRRREIVPRLAGAAFGEAKAASNGLLTASWRMGDGATLHLLANLSDLEIANTSGEFKGTLIWGSELGERVPPWSVHWRIG
ncbi:malto-oligosyltrehalose trehalohydrolase [Bradyrhizobium sp. AUGA SZCCT0431]|uniref:malto-oligosyltrehalose trehalohydrolase n=1 Tax=Bradyrhizobium sp. AUGA SZCCT0431 TaxID=2807674 RepID=UPI001BA4D3CD|nr:malto-oligosyltrehalose trehalohydrolase [Bradyrhizobium sp. AUGA SZCCT0431]MBR1144314.1 malto-oligosyltrehalose trehalohydrolase [Bradyrhizobium sp. AUGA SZCCT0431]